jgi:hypothetical protein
VEIPPILKNKWVLIGGAVVVIIALMMAGGSSGSGSGTVSTGPSDAEVAASHDIALAQIAAQSTQMQANAQLAAITQQGQIDMATATLNAQLSQYAVDANTALQSLQINTTREIQLADMSSQERRETASINSQTQLAKWTLDQATLNTQIQTDFQLQYAEAANATNVSLAQMQAQLVNNQLIANRDVTLAGLATQESLAATNAALQRDVTYSNNQTQQAVYQSMMAGQVEMTRISAVNETERTRLIASGQKHSSTMGFLGGVVGVLGGLFSEPALKKNVRQVGQRSDGLGLYTFDYLDEFRPVLWGGPAYAQLGDFAGNPSIIGANVNTGGRLGVMADEVERVRPSALGRKLLGMRTVNYAAL